MLTSRDNPHIKLVRSLNSTHKRQKTGLYFIEGAKMLREAMLADINNIVFVLYSSDFNDKMGLLHELQLKNIDVFEVAPSILRNVTDTVSPQGILAVLKQRRDDWRSLLNKERMLLLMTDNVQDPGNIGTMIRTADAMGFSSVLMSRGTVDLYNPKVLRATMGSFFHLSVYDRLCLQEVLDAFKRVGITILVAMPYADLNLESVVVSDRMVVVIGNESKGISSAVLERADHMFKIPMPGMAESLNASVAAGIIMYELSRRWHAI